jgi:hypothetical protein
MQKMAQLDVKSGAIKLIAPFFGTIVVYWDENCGAISRSLP